MTVVKLNGSRFFFHEPQIKMITVQSLWHNQNLEQLSEPRLEPVSNGY